MLTGHVLHAKPFPVNALNNHFKILYNTFVINDKGKIKSSEFRRAINVEIGTCWSTKIPSAHFCDQENMRKVY